ncbi:AraC family transcriptional regulator [Shewanella maritima]|uniref:AraC family transcriptional regulator n=1 Tax=Shewanella maritima TaxID=2520507 RepID=A0A411PJC4_9GAMM|nr:AraC family transcriptional regulator [Shewanella maritima]QBF83643.1 AraC family transcriptional regulator [Shewanella maritima]
MKTASKFNIPSNWLVLFNDLGLELEQILAFSQLPAGLFKRSKVQLTPEQYFQLWIGIEAAAEAANIDIALKFAEVMSFEQFDAPIFAAICSPNLNAAASRLKQFKPLIGPMILDIEQTAQYTELSTRCYGHSGKLPKVLSLVELVFFTQLTRLATRQHIKPIDIVVPEQLDDMQPYEDYFGCSIRQGVQTAIKFSASDAKAPFLTSNETMLHMYEQGLVEQLEAIGAKDSTSSLVFSCLLDLLPQGKSAIDDVAAELAMSKRTLQRKLTEQDSSYQLVLKQVRQHLADYYLEQTDLPLIEISFLLGFKESNSFIRAYSGWSGVSPARTRH